MNIPILKIHERVEKMMDDSDARTPESLRELAVECERQAAEIEGRDGLGISGAVRLPDGSGCFTASMPLPKSHWLYAEGREDPPPPRVIDPYQRLVAEEQITKATRYAIRRATMNGREMDWDPDALVQNMMVALLGPRRIS